MGLGCSEILAIAWVAKVWEAKTHTQALEYRWYSAIEGFNFSNVLGSGKKWGKVVGCG